MYKAEDYEVKLECLGHAAHTCKGIDSDAVIYAAQKFYDFVTDGYDADGAEVLFADEVPNAHYDGWTQGYDDGYEQATTDIRDLYEEDTEEGVLNLGDWDDGYNAGLNDALRRLEVNLEGIKREESEDD